MSSRSREDLRCPICHGVFKDPVLLLCGHSFCKDCWQRWWLERFAHECPVCKTKSLLFHPPRNLALKNLSEAFLEQRESRKSAALCGLHSEDLKLFCLDHQQPVCHICLHSSSHTSHSFRPVDEAAMDYKEALRVLLKPLQQKLELFNDIKGNFDQMAKDIDIQAQDTERQINDEFSMLQKFLQKEQQERIAKVQAEKRQNSQMLKRKTEALSRELAALSDTVVATEDVLRAEDLKFLQNYKTTAEKVDRLQINDPQPSPGDLMDMAKHLRNLPFAVLESVKKMIPTTKTNPEPPQNSPKEPKSTAVSTMPSRVEVLASLAALLGKYEVKEITCFEDDTDLFG
ncbi:E3 ubiquitin-protein ligase TRIM35-like [Anoplopoma fimbria]|uniref:E3 ubiquitin-protein ligase TRIM35-like n=1 Tax=Anoplopoma fimbria TaxID=229290 RepID=UPI0023EC7D96|nr:E3 ubiquitin-protein ligase TRIM35-like [Anoplopoma fimbria]